MPLKRDRRRARRALSNAGVMAAERERQRYEAIGEEIERRALLAQEWIWPIMMAFLWDNVAIVAALNCLDRCGVPVHWPLE